MANQLEASDRRLLHAKAIWSALSDMELRHDAERRAYVEALTEDEQVALANDAQLFSQTNCGWFEYAAMHKAGAEAAWRVRARAAMTPAERLGIAEPSR